jgi:hypothetical protein
MCLCAKLINKLNLLTPFRLLSLRCGVPVLLTHRALMFNETNKREREIIYIKILFPCQLHESDAQRRRRRIVSRAINAVFMFIKHKGTLSLAHCSIKSTSMCFKTTRLMNGQRCN